jgi:prevent-host-death family protein
MTWQVQEAKQKFSRLVQCALDEGPQVVTRHGEAVVVVLAADEYRKLTAPRPDFRKFLQDAPDLGKLHLDRITDLPRDVEL